jgi:hypothetical protein
MHSDFGQYVAGRKLKIVQREITFGGFEVGGCRWGLPVSCRTEIERESVNDNSESSHSEHLRNQISASSGSKYDRSDKPSKGFSAQSTLDLFLCATNSNDNAQNV